MPVANINNTLINKLQPKAQRYEIRDQRIKGFMIRVQPTGQKTYLVEYARGKRISIGKVDILTLAQAREKALRVLSDYTRGLLSANSLHGKAEMPTLRVFLDQDYAAWVRAHNPSGDEAIKTIERHFRHIMEKPLNAIKVQDIEKWRTKKLETQAMKPNTINRTITPLRSAISKAVEWGILKEHVLASLKPLKYDDTRIRYLSEDERKRLFLAVEQREKKLKQKRLTANEWRQSRHKALYPVIVDDEFSDYLKPMIIIALNTGVRRSELLNLKRQDINLEQGTLFVEKSKNYLARHIPLNKAAKQALAQWLKPTQRMNSRYVFPNLSQPEKPLKSVKKAWTKIIKEDAGIEDFRWHDLRHDFASRLVMKNVSLYVVQKLLGHRKIEQTMKYAHLAPEFIAESVGRLD
tara:strand:- start:10950 stop:12170 length:1221 start_codon:yes stop_codon:yes gene_type:complete